jgi:hypothetical protein
MDKSGEKIGEIREVKMRESDHRGVWIDTPAGLVHVAFNGTTEIMIGFYGPNKVMISHDRKLKIEYFPF